MLQMNVHLTQCFKYSAKFILSIIVSFFTQFSLNALVNIKHEIYSIIGFVTDVINFFIQNYKVISVTNMSIVSQEISDLGT